MDCCVEGYLTNFFAHCTMVMKKEMDGDSTLCFFLKTPWVPCVHTFYHRQRVEESPSKLPPMTGSSKPLRWNSFFRCLSLQTQPLSLNLELPCTFLTQRGVSSFSAFGSSFLMNIMIFLGDIPVYLVMVTVFCDLLISHESNSAARKEKGTINGQCYKNKNLKK